LIHAGDDDLHATRRTPIQEQNMATTVFETYGVIRSDGTLELEQKLAGPPGRVKVRVESMEAVPESAEDFARRFAALTARWKEETRFSSKIKSRLEHPAFREVVAMGERAVPLILADLEKNGGFGFLALEKIIGVDPVPKEIYGNHDEMAAAWIAWGRDQGHRRENAV
jgi:hypothetical protein